MCESLHFAVNVNIKLFFFTFLLLTNNHHFIAELSFILSWLSTTLNEFTVELGHCIPNVVSQIRATYIGGGISALNGHGHNIYYQTERRRWE